MPVPWLLLTLALGRSPRVLSLERGVGLQSTAHCSAGLSCRLWDGEGLCLLGTGTVEPAPGPVLEPSRLQTELVLRCHEEEADCDLCLRMDIHLAVHGHWEEPEDKELEGAANPEAGEAGKAGNAALQSHLLLSFQDHPSAGCFLLEVQVPASRVRSGLSAGSVMFDCFEAALGGEVQIWSYTQPRYQKEPNLTQAMPAALPWLSPSADSKDRRLVLDISEGQHFGISLYWDQDWAPPEPKWQANLTGPQNFTLNHRVLVPCLCVQVWLLELDAKRTNHCPFQKDPRAHWNLWRAAQLQLLPPLGWRLVAPCPLFAEVVLCWRAPGGTPCQPLVPQLSWKNITVKELLRFPLLKGHPNLCVQVSNWEKLQLEDCLWADSLGPPKDDVLLVEKRGSQDNRSFCALEASGCTPLPSRTSTRAARHGEQLLWDLQSGLCEQLWNDTLGALWACSMDKYIHKRWVLVWLACLLTAATLLLLLLLKKNQVKEATRGRRALLLYSPDNASCERLVGVLASALCRLPLRVTVDLWSRRELSTQGPLAWFHSQRRQTLQEGGVVVLLFSPGAVALCSEWLQDAASAPGAHTPNDAFAASLSCVLPDFLQGRAPGRYVGACFDRLLPVAAVPALFRSVPIYSLPAQLPDFLEALRGSDGPRTGRRRERTEPVARALQHALDSCFPPLAGPGLDRR
ncbi:interleukin-17 receptor C [Echinops telfairi]|uniref:Interleukin-17 receptor C n=1 Tax=Echinops telfairi TaxID=9371 RepID=A0AC55D2D5_ECHTE|nr:interleukin-17 receptor C [Echinops telfairi]